MDQFSAGPAGAASFLKPQISWREQINLIKAQRALVWPILVHYSLY